MLGDWLDSPDRRWDVRVPQPGAYRSHPFQLVVKCRKAEALCGIVGEAGGSPSPLLFEMFYMIGLGLGDAKDITVKGLEVVRRCSRVYLEAYTSVLTVGKEVL
ncbi:DPH5, partial [Cervus elaphus hippelaphus]